MTPLKDIHALKRLTAERDAALAKLDILERSIADLSHPNMRMLLADQDGALAELKRVTEHYQATMDRFEKEAMPELELLISQRDAERAARKALQDAADVFAADQSRAPHPACGLVQPVTVDDCEALNAALALAAKLP